MGKNLIKKLVLPLILAFGISNNICNSSFSSINPNDFLSRKEFIEKINEVFSIMDSITYKPDSIVHNIQYYWQIPKETNSLGTGDCCDQATLAQILFQERGIYTNLIWCRLHAESTEDHLINEIIYKNTPYIIETSSKKSRIINKKKIDLSKKYIPLSLTKENINEIKRFEKKSKTKLDFKYY